MFSTHTYVCNQNNVTKEMNGQNMHAYSHYLFGVLHRHLIFLRRAKGQITRNGFKDCVRIKV